MKGMQVTIDNKLWNIARIDDYSIGEVDFVLAYVVQVDGEDLHYCRVSKNEFTTPVPCKNKTLTDLLKQKRFALKGDIHE